MAAYYGMIESGLNESYYRYAEKHNHYLQTEFPEVNEIITEIGAKIIHKSGVKAGSLPMVPRDKKYFLMAGFNLQLKTWTLYNIHTDTEGLLQYPESIFNPDTRAYSAVISIKRTAQYVQDRLRKPFQSQRSDQAVRPTAPRSVALERSAPSCCDVRFAWHRAPLAPCLRRHQPSARRSLAPWALRV
jgi:hypothetical protein